MTTSGTAVPNKVRAMVTAAYSEVVSSDLGPTSFCNFRTCPSSRATRFARASRASESDAVAGMAFTYVPRPELVATSPSAASCRTAWMAVPCATPYPSAKARTDGIREPTGSAPVRMSARRSSAMRW